MPLDEDFDVAAEMADCLQKLAKAASRDRIDALIEKERLDSLDEAELSELRELGQNSDRAQNTVD